mmetsp:Transcript_9703/g.12099  ORF Transcript_9703/g.12099 Transcript_9703/m.12099 type:complete len:322 (+) Transcript_9703:132-1097(+)
MIQKILILGVIGAILGVVAYIHGTHFVNEGSIGIYWLGGKLLEKYSTPGYHVMFPIVTTFMPIQVSMKTTKIENVPCGTSGGVEMMFQQVEVVHRLRAADAIQTVKEYSIDFEKTWIVDRIHQEMNQLCSIYSLHEIFISKFDQMDETLKRMIENMNSRFVPGIEIISVRLSKPLIPPILLKTFEEIEQQASKLKVVLEHEKLVVKNAETERKRQVMLAEKKKDVSDIEWEQALSKKQSEVEISRIQDEMFKSSDKEQADSEYYRSLKLADANKYLLTPEYLLMQRAQMMTTNTEYYLGKNIPNAIFTDSVENTIQLAEYI